MTAAQQVRQLRTDLQLPQHEFAALLGVTQGAVAHYETGRRSPINVARKLEKLARDHGLLKYRIEHFVPELDTCE
jgi:DNA-binding transcriptional regulator YiaG